MIHRGKYALIIATFGCGILIGWSGAVLWPASSTPIRQTAAASTGIGEIAHIPGAAQITADSKRNAEAHSGDKSTTSAQRVSALGSALREALNIADPIDRVIRLREIIATIPPDQFPDVFAVARKMNGAEQRDIMEVLGKRWVESNPREAVEFASRSTSSLNLLKGMLQEWCNTSPRDVLAWIQSHPASSNNRTFILHGIVETLAQTDPQNSLALLKSKFAPGEWNPSGFFSSWAERDPRSAAAAAASLTGELRGTALRAVASLWVSSDPGSAINWANTISNPSDRKELVESIGKTWASINPQEAISWARGISDEAAARNIFSAAVAHLAETDIDSAVEQIQMMPQGDGRTQVVIAAAKSAAQKDARGALQLLEMAPRGSQRTQEALDICFQWGNSDPHSVLQWMTTNLAAMNDSRVGDIVSGWMKSAPEAALDWAQALPANEWRDTIMGYAVQKLAASDLQRAQAMFTSLSPDAQANAAWEIADTLQRSGRRQALDWAETLPPGEAQNQAYKPIIWDWARQNPTEVAQWMASLPRGQTRDEAVNHFASAIMERDPERAMAAALSIDDPRDRYQSIASLYQSWRRTNSAAAQNWLQNNNQVTDELRQRILNH